ncbi:hypothetical protein IQ07DRAFT_644884 [Pyrenochaeta sp. DS3sAY3a]|nr:hypothetical protein IQ07DRAFT_644884 [Pyrenochaeta sp. DS3sAY3a]
MRSSFLSVDKVILVGIGGGVPLTWKDIRLGDVVIGIPHERHAGVLNYRYDLAAPWQLFPKISPVTPPPVLLKAALEQDARQLQGIGGLAKHLKSFDHIPSFRRENAGPDILFQAGYDHKEGSTCANSCNHERQVPRATRDNFDPVVHHGTIVSSDWDMSSGFIRDTLSEKLGNVHCFDVTTAALVNYPSLVVRGISDYADSHKSSSWRPYAAATAAACAKDILSLIPAAASGDLGGIATEKIYAEAFIQQKETKSAHERIELKLDQLFRHLQLGSSLPTMFQSEQVLKRELVDDNITEVDVENDRAFIHEWMKNTYHEDVSHDSKRAERFSRDESDGEATSRTRSPPMSLAPSITDTSRRKPQHPAYSIDVKDMDQPVLADKEPHGHAPLSDAVSKARLRAYHTTFRSTGDFDATKDRELLIPSATIHEKLTSDDDAMSPSHPQELEKQGHYQYEDSIHSTSETEDEWDNFDLSDIFPNSSSKQPDKTLHRTAQSESQSNARATSASRKKHGVPKSGYTGFESLMAFYADNPSERAKQDLRSNYVPYFDYTIPTPGNHHSRRASHAVPSLPRPWIPPQSTPEYVPIYDNPQPRRPKSARSNILVNEFPLPVSLEDIFSRGKKRATYPRKIVDTKKDLTVVEDHSLYLRIKIPMEPGFKYKFRGRGDVIDGIAHDVHFIINYEPHPLFTLKGYDLYQTLDINLRDSLCGWSRQVRSITGRELEVSHSGPTRPDWEKRFPGFGMHIPSSPNGRGDYCRGDFVVQVNILQPVNLTASEKAAIWDLFAKVDFGEKG